MFSFASETSGDTLILHLSGTIDEHTDFSQLPQDVRGNLILDLRNVRSLNSVGCRNWILWLKKVKVGKNLICRACSTPIVHQISILHGFLPPNAKVESIHVPYYCDACTHEESLLVNCQDVDMKTLSQDRVCPECGGASLLDVVPERYFRFLNQRESS